MKPEDLKTMGNKELILKYAAIVSSRSGYFFGQYSFMEDKYKQEAVLKKEILSRMVPMKMIKLKVKSI